MILILEFISIAVAWIITIGIFTLIFDGKNAFKKKRQ